MMDNKQRRKGDLPILPGPVLRNIFECLGAQDLLSCRRTCRTWNRVLLYYDFLPEKVADFYIDCKPLKPGRLRKIFKFGNSLTTELKSLLEMYNEHCALYFLRPKLELSIVAFEEIESFSPFISAKCFRRVLKQVTKLKIEIGSQKKFGKMQLSDFPEFLSLMPNLRHATLPLDLMSIFTFPRVDQVTFFKGRPMSSITSLQIQFPETSYLLNSEDHYVLLISEVTKVLSYPKFASLKSLKLSSKPDTSWKPPAPKLTANEVDGLFAKVDNIVNALGGKMQSNIVKLVASELVLRELEISLDGFSMSVFDNAGLLSLFAFLAMRGLRRLTLRVEGRELHTSLPTILHTMSRNYGTKIELDLLFYLSGSESHITSQYILSLPEIFDIVRSITIRFLANFDLHNNMFFLEDFIPLHVKLDSTQEHTNFSKLSNFAVEFQEPTHKVFLTFTWLRSVWPWLKHISIIVGRSENFESERSMAWEMFKEKWKGRRNGSVTNIFYLRGLLKFFPCLETLKMWADLRHATDVTFIVVPSRPNDVDHSLAKLQKLSLRGLGPQVTDNCVKGILEMKELKYVELIGNHSITNLARDQLMEILPHLKEVKLKL